MHTSSLVFDVPLWLLLATTGVAALEGAIIGRQSRAPRYDVVGLFVLAFVMGLSAGVVRDILLGNLPIAVARTPWYIVTVIAAAVVVIVAGRLLPSHSGMWFTLLDALALGLYTALATSYALQMDLPLVGAVLVGVASGIAGGIIVALLRGRTASVLVPGTLYAVTALAGSLIYAAVFPMSSRAAVIAAVGAVVLLRIISVHFNLGTHALPLLADPPRKRT